MKLLQLNFFIELGPVRSPGQVLGKGSVEVGRRSASSLAISDLIFSSLYPGRLSACTVCWTLFWCTCADVQCGALFAVVFFGIRALKAQGPGFFPPAGSRGRRGEGHPPGEGQHKLYKIMTRVVIGMSCRTVCCGRMDTSGSAGFSMSFRKVVPWRLSNDALAQPWLQLRWLTADAQGQLFQGECLQRALRQCQALGVKNEDINFLMYLGMYAEDCGCDWCGERRVRHAREQECLPGRGQGRLRQVSLDAPVQPVDDPAPAQVQNQGWLRDEYGDSRLSAPDARPESRHDAPVRRYKSERYAVQKPVMNDMLMRLHCETTPS
jgi:hypothetical protein